MLFLDMRWILLLEKDFFCAIEHNFLVLARKRVLIQNVSSCNIQVVMSSDGLVILEFGLGLDNLQMDHHDLSVFEKYLFNRPCILEFGLVIFWKYSSPPLYNSFFEQTPLYNSFHVKLLISFTRSKLLANILLETSFNLERRVHHGNLSCCQRRVVRLWHLPKSR